MPRIFGRHAAVDVRDTKYQLRAAKSTRRFRYWDDTAYFGDQGDSAHCVGYAWMHWLVNSPISNYVDPDGLYTLAQFVDEWPGERYEGTSVRAGAKVLKSLGFIERYEWTWDVQTLIDTVLELGPVVVGTDWLAGMDKPDKAGIIKATGRSLGGHAYLINGCSQDREFFRIKNSWGESWADNGRAWISFNDMAKLIKAEGEVCLAVERLSKPPELRRPTIQTTDGGTAPQAAVGLERAMRSEPAQMIPRPRKGTPKLTRGELLT